MSMRGTFSYKWTLLNKAISIVEYFLEKALRWCSPLYVIIAISLILTVAYVFFFILLIEVAPLEENHILVMHKILATILLFNILFNYSMCVISPPGSTSDLDQSVNHLLPLSHSMVFSQVLYNGYAEHRWRYCKICDLPKPDLAHHCSICNKCILRMDHHCPWIGNCVGHRNYRYFYLFLFYITIGCFYAFVMMYYHRHVFLFHKDHLVLPMFCTVLCAALGFAVGNLFLWHTFLIITGQGTIDFLENFRQWKEAIKEGKIWKNPYSQGCIKNFKSVFDVDGTFWWILWMKPTLKPKLGTGLYTITHPLVTEIVLKND